MKTHLLGDSGVAFGSIAPEIPRIERSGVPLPPAAATSLSPQGWPSRGYRPSFEPVGNVQSLTFRLADAVPMKQIERWERELGLGMLRAANPADTEATWSRCELQKRIERWEDSGQGECWLRNPEIAAVVDNALRFFDGVRYRLLGWCIMPNHVHVVLEFLPGFAVPEVLHSWKTVTTREANRRLGRTGALWSEDHFEGYLRTTEHFQRVLDSVADNPVKAGLVLRRDLWRWSHAGNRDVPTVLRPR